MNRFHRNRAFSKKVCVDVESQTPKPIVMKSLVRFSKSKDYESAKTEWSMMEILGSEHPYNRMAEDILNLSARLLNSERV